MAKNTAPLFGFGAGGQLGKAIVFAKWRGVPYTRAYVKPANPRSTKQVEVRNIFSMLNEFWKIAPTKMVEAWTASAQGRSFTDRNNFQSKNIQGLYDDPVETDMANFVGSPGAKGGVPPTAIVLTPGSGTINAALTLPQTPTGWTLDEAVGIAFLDQAPSVAWTNPIEVGTPDGDNDEIDWTGLDVSSDYVVSIWLKWTKPDGTSAYSVSLTDITTTTA